MKRILLLLTATIMLLAAPVWGATDVTFNWDSNTEADISHYEIWRSDDNKATWHKVSPEAGIPHTGSGTEAWTELGVPDGTYFWFATAVDDSGNVSDPSNIVSAKLDSTPPAPPGNFLIAMLKRILAFLLDLFRGGFRSV